MIGRVLGGRYRIEDVLDEGGAAVVFRGVHVELGRRVAIKVLHAALRRNEEARGRFEREARALAALQHPNVVGLVDFGVDGESPYLVMELLEGWSLRELLSDQSTLAFDRARGILRQVLRALAAAHHEGLLHRDLKPANVFLQRLPDTDDHVKLLDFGLAKSLHPTDGPALTRAGTISGTPAFMAPEQISAREVDERADVYAAGVVFYEMLAGRCPFEGSMEDVLRAKILAAAPSLADARSDTVVAPELERLLATALDREPSARFASADAMLEALEALPDGSLTERPYGRAEPFAPTVPPPSAVPAQPGRPRAAPTALLLAVPAVVLPLIVLACLVAGVALWLGGADETPAKVGSEHEKEPEPPVVEAVESDDITVPTPWRGEVPEVLADVRARFEAGAIGDEDVRTLRSEARRRPDDPRPHLLLGHVYFSRGWRSDALPAYERAFAIETTARGDQKMLDNLVAMAAHPAVTDRATRAVRTIYGREALRTIDRALATGGLRASGRARLERLRDYLAQR
jgi:serine/threonine-protein kinase